MYGAMDAASGRESLETVQRGRPSPLRVLHLANHCRNSGNGIVNVAVDLACAQSERGDAVAYASAPGELDAVLAGAKVRQELLDQRRRAPWAVIAMLFRYAALVRAWKPDVVHAHMLTGAILAWLLRPFFGYAIATTVHNEFQRFSSVMRVGDVVIAVSASVANALIARGFPAERVSVVLNGSVGSRRRRRGVSPAPLQRPSIITVAGLNDRKGIPDLMAAFERIAKESAEAHLYLVGDGPKRREYERRARKSGVAERIHFVGFCPDPTPYFEACDLFVLASRDEPFGLVLTEAREAGCAIVASQTGGIPEALDGGKAGVLVEPRNVTALAEAMLVMLRNTDRRRAYTAAARNNLERFSVERMESEVRQAYARVLGAGFRERDDRAYS